MKGRVRKLLFAALIFVAPGCDGQAGAPASCSMPLEPYQPSGACREMSEQVTGVCLANTAQGKGLYILCAVDPTGNIFVLDAASDQKFNQSGWSFGPKNTAVGIFHLPPVSGQDEAACESAAQHPTTQAIPVCAPDAGAVDGGFD